MFRFVLLAAFSSYVELAYASACPIPFSEVGSKCYWKSVTAATYDHSLKICQEIGGKLASPKTPEENKLLREFLRNEFGHFWTGGKQVKTGEQEYQWDDGSEITYRDWQPNEPNYFTKSEPICILIFPQYGWDDYPCNKSYMAICELDTKLKPTEEPQKVSDCRCEECEEKVLMLMKQMSKKDEEIKHLQTQVSDSQRKRKCTRKTKTEAVCKRKTTLSDKD